MDKPQAEVDQHPPVTHSPDHVPAKTRDLNPAPDADGFGTLSSTESEKHIDSQTQSPEGEAVNRVSSASRKSVHWSPELVSGTDDGGSNPYVARDPAPSFNLQETMGTVKDVLGRWGKKVGEATKKAEVLAGNTWQHFKTGPSFAEAAMGRLAQGTKVLAEGGYEKIFRQTFDTVPEEQLLDCYACYLSTSAGPVMGVLYVSSAKLAYCSDSPLSYKNGSQTEWSYYKVVIPLHQLKAVNPSTSKVNPSEKYMQVISVDNHEFWFMGFLNYDGAVQCLEEAFNSHKL